MKRLGPAAITLTVALAALATALPAPADEHRDGGRHEEGRGRESPGRSHEGRQWQGRIEHFHEHDYGRWREGHWEHERHEGRYGWWWITPGPFFSWYYYPAPVYPYPDPYQPPVVVVPPAVSPAPVAPATPPPPQYWYYCDSAGGYYPYVPTCPSGWRAVPAAPAR
jgi:hypothetical protein